MPKFGSNHNGFSVSHMRSSSVDMPTCVVYESHVPSTMSRVPLTMHYSPRSDISGHFPGDFQPAAEPYTQCGLL